MAIIKQGSQIPTEEYLIFLLQNPTFKKEEVVNIQQQCLLLLEEQIRRFTGGDSSASKERAQSLMDSLLYMISYYLKNFDSNKAIQMLLENKILTLYQQAKAFIQKQLSNLEQAIIHLNSQLLDIPLLVYKDTLRFALPQFYTSYNLDYQAMDIVLTLDYPAFIPVFGKLNLEALFTYVQRMLIEHQFYTFLPTDAIQEVLQQYHHGDPNLIFNVTELLWKQLLVKQMGENYEASLCVNTKTLNHVYTRFQDKTQTQIEAVVLQCFSTITQQFQIYNQELVAYLELGMQSISSELYLGIQNRNLDSELAVIKKS